MCTQRQIQSPGNSSDFSVTPRDKSRAAFHSSFHSFNLFQNTLPGAKTSTGKYLANKWVHRDCYKSLKCQQWEPSSENRVKHRTANALPGAGFYWESINKHTFIPSSPFLNFCLLIFIYFTYFIYLFLFPFSQYCARSKTNAVRPSHLTHEGKGKGVMDRALLQENYHMSLGCTVYSHPLKNFKTSFCSLPIQTKTSVFASYPTISYKCKNKGFIKLSFCFLRASSRRHNLGPAAAWNVPGPAQVTVLSLQPEDAPRQE